MSVLRRPAFFLYGKPEDSASSTSSNQSPTGCAGPAGVHLSQGRSESSLSCQRLGLSGLRLRQRGRALRLKLLHKIRAGCLGLFLGSGLLQAQPQHPPPSTQQASILTKHKCPDGEAFQVWPLLPPTRHRSQSTPCKAPGIRLCLGRAAREVFNRQPHQHTHSRISSLSSWGSPQATASAHPGRQPSYDMPLHEVQPAWVAGLTWGGLRRAS